MHAAFFALKRAHQATLKMGRADFAALGLTAARFDMLYAIAQRPVNTMLQSDLRRMLGVSRATTSRMLSSLESLGLVVRTRHMTDGRERSIVLSPRGASRIRRAIWRMITTGQAQLAVDSALGAGQWFDDDVCFLALSALETALRRLRRTFSDLATLEYPWHPDD